MKFVVRSPMRVDLAGGTLDLWPLYNFVDHAVTINVAIDLSTQAELIPLKGQEVQLCSHDLQVDQTFPNLEVALQTQDRRLSLLVEMVRYWRPKMGFRLETRSDSSIGGGLGGSSSLVISLLKVFEQWLELPFANSIDRVRVAHNIEARVLNTPTGTQDYFPADNGGVCVIDYRMDGTQLSVESVPSGLQERFLLVSTGKAHHSGLNNFEVLTRAVQRDPQTHRALQELAIISREVVQHVRSQNWGALGACFQKEFRYRVQLAKAFSSPEIERLEDISLNAGAEAVKICGAGGGGSVLVWVDPHKREEVAVACQKAGFQVLAAKPVAPLNQT